VVALLHAADMLALPARIAPDGDRDGLPNVLLEAMATALPVVATPVSAIPEAVRDGTDGLLVPPDDPAALAAALAHLARAPGERSRLGAAARARMVASFASQAGLDRLAARLGAPQPPRAPAPAAIVACASPSTRP
jgi:glycosyltransferase involved in cell wall biosynthesis